MARDWFDIVRTGNAWHGPEEFGRPVAHTVSLLALLVRKWRALRLWGL